MQTRTVIEFGRIQRSSLERRLVRRLEALDCEHTRLSGAPIFDWTRRDYFRALNHVGVVQVPGLQVQILPKIDELRRGDSDSDRAQLAQRNLLYMLSVARTIPLSERDIASQRLDRRPLLDALILVFVTKLLSELRRGLHHSYVCQEENLRYIKGKMIMEQHLRRNVIRRHCTYVTYDDFVTDTPVNQILKATCLLLLRMTRSTELRQKLSEALLDLADVSEVWIVPSHFDRIAADRSVERFSHLLAFARIVLFGMTVTPRAGNTDSFSLLFPMDRLFEEFIGRSIQRYAPELGIQRSDVHLQAKGRRRWLLRTSDGKGRFRLKPDVLIDGEHGSPRLIIDTKWKRLAIDLEDSKNGVSQADLYQMFAYAHRFECSHCVLAYPRIHGVVAKTYHIEDGNSKSIRIGLIDVSHDMVTDNWAFRQDLTNLVS